MQKIYDQKELIHTTDWDYLIILDACRYDYFEKVYKEFFRDIEGKYKIRFLKVISPANNTIEWVKKVFGDRKYDIVYISGNPYINSKGYRKLNFNASKHFKIIEDVWFYGWSRKYRTVLPNKINSVATSYITKHKIKQEKMIIHYMQPHIPYIYEYINKKFLFSEKKTENSKNTDHPWYSKDIINSIRYSLSTFLLKILNKKYIYLEKFLRKLRLSYIPYPERYAKKMGIKKLKICYSYNLKYVLRYVMNLVEKIPYGKIVITSDHGELLGEEGIYGHPAWAKHSKLFEVPWLEIDKGRKKVGEKVEGEEKEEEKEYSKNDEEIIKERLRALGYLE